MEEKRPLQAEELLEQIFYFMSQMVNEKDFKKTLLLLTDMGRTLVNAERASFWYWDVEKGEYWTLMASDTEQLVIPEGTGIVGATIENNETIVINDPYKDERFNSKVDEKTGFVTKSILCMPVTNATGGVIGAYQVINKLGDNGESAFDEKDVKRLTLAAAYSGKTLESHLLYQAANIDSLTQLKNRRGFYEYYNIQIIPTLKQDKASVIMCDIDFFKKVNDTYGHNAGDAVLQEVADVLREVEGGEAFRWGGEEFLLLLPGKNLKQACKTAEIIRRTVERMVCHFEGEDIQVTMSFGVKELEGGYTAETNIEDVDALLYRAKTTGRNRVVGKSEEL